MKLFTFLLFFCILCSSYAVAGSARARGLTFFQKEKIRYLQLEAEAKITVLKNELFLKKKLFAEEITNPNDKVDIFLLEQLADDIKYLALTMQQLWIDAELALRNSMSYEQYLEFKTGQKE